MADDSGYVADEIPPYVEEQLSNSCTLINQLIKRDDLQAGAASMPSRQVTGELFFASGIAFLYVKKGAAGVSGASGHGFVLAKIPSEGDQVLPCTNEAEMRIRARWSAPLFLKVHLVGLGFSVGYTNIHSCIIVDTMEEVQKFAKSRIMVGGSIGGALGKEVGAYLVMGRKENKTLFSYHTVGGASADLFSMETAWVSPSKSTMNAVYGAGWDAERVLDGTVAAPPGCEQLYSLLDEMQAVYLAELRQAARMRAEQGVD